MRRKKRQFFDNVTLEDSFLDSSNLPGFNVYAAEGKIVKALSTKELYILGFIFLFIIAVFIYQLFILQILKGDNYYKLSTNNTLSKPIIFAERGIIKDRLGRELVWNEPRLNSKSTSLLPDYSLRKYTKSKGMSHLLGYVSYPIADRGGNWWRSDFVANTGVELSFNDFLQGANGYRLIEINAQNNIVSSGSIKPAINGKNMRLSIDSELNEKLYEAIKNGVVTSGFKGGAGVLINVHTGQILSITSYPEYDSNILTDATDKDTIHKYNIDSRKPFLNRAIQGSYTPGSIIKPYIGSAALEEEIITENTKILSTGVLKVPNKYHPGKFSTFKDWRNGLGWLDIREAIKMSSSIFFYVVGGGHGNQEGLGISKISKWGSIFGFGKKTGVKLPSETKGLVPTPEWQKSVFGPSSVWRLGNTYHSAIGQYGWLVTPIQAAQYIASIANGGDLYSPTLQYQKTSFKKKIPIKKYNFQIIREGMRRGALAGTAQALNINGITLSAKTGTAQLGKNNEYMNSWVVGFWPYDNPEFAFAVVLERAKANTLRGAAPAMRPFFEWLVTKHSEDYAIGKYPQKLVK